LLRSEESWNGVGENVVKNLGWVGQLQRYLNRSIERNLTIACHHSPMSTYRWNSTEAARAYDAAAPVIHPLYDEVQRRILKLLANEVEAGEPFLLVDIGGGSGRIVEKFLDRFPTARAVLVDQSAAFLAIAVERLARFGDRFELVEKRLQDDWAAELPATPQAIVSTSAIHHLESAEKQRCYAQCFAALAPGGTLINGDEFRPADDAEFRARLERWSAHMKGAIADGRIPASFQATYNHWHDRNITNFGAPHKSGDDCQETSDVQQRYLRELGFTDVEVPWTQEMWGVLVGRKP
jgi:tRNA (cmo5U34)-methyltransferase